MAHSAALVVLLCAAFVAGQEVSTDNEGNLVLSTRTNSDVHVAIGSDDKIPLGSTLSQMKSDFDEIKGEVLGREGRDDTPGPDAGLSVNSYATVTALGEVHVTNKAMLDKLNSMDDTVSLLNEVVEGQQAVLQDIQRESMYDTSATVSYIQGCSSECVFTNGEINNITIVGRNFIKIADAYMCHFTIASTMDSANVIAVPVQGLTGSENEVHCEIPTFTPAQTFASKYQVVVTLHEGGVHQVNSYRNQEQTIQIETSGPTISEIAGPLIYGTPSFTSGNEKTIALKVADKDTTDDKLELVAKSSKTNLVQIVSFTTTELKWRRASSNALGEVTITLTVTEKEHAEVSITKSFKIRLVDYPASCAEVLSGDPSAQAGTYDIKLKGDNSPTKLYCEFIGGVGWTMCGKYRPMVDQGLYGLDSPFGRDVVAGADVSDPWSWTVAQQQASVDCRKIPATHVLSACYTNEQGSDPIDFRVMNLNKETVADNTDLFDVSKQEDLVASDIQNGGRVTWALGPEGWEDVGNYDDTARLTPRSTWATATSFNDYRRAGSLFSNAGNPKGTYDDTVFWGFKGPQNPNDNDEANWEYPDLYCAAIKGSFQGRNPNERTIGTVCLGGRHFETTKDEYYCSNSVMFFGEPPLPYEF